MGTYSGTYESDLGYDFHAITLSTRFDLTGETQGLIPDESALIPDTFLQVVSDGKGPCSLPVTPRRVQLYLSEVVRFICPIPFRGGTALYQQFLNQVEALDDVRAYDVLPEVEKPSQVILQVR